MDSLPKLFQTIEASLLSMKQMNHHIAIIHQNPATGIVALNMIRYSMVIVFHILFNFRRQGFNVGHRVAGSQNKSVGQNGFTLNIDDFDIKSFLFLQNFPYIRCGFFSGQKITLLLN